MSTFNLKIITPEKLFFEGKAVQLIARTESGNVGIMADHAPYVANLVPYSLKIKTDSNQEFRVAAIAGGFIKVFKNDVVITTHAIEWAEDIDIMRAKKAKEQAEKLLQDHNSDKEFVRAEQKLKRAVNRISISEKY
ncbi:MAG: ATP synthase F1 subunit epsilon [Oscillospiraceae bacterium]